MCRFKLSINRLSILIFQTEISFILLCTSKTVSIVTVETNISNLSHTNVLISTLPTLEFQLFPSGSKVVFRFKSNTFPQCPKRPLKAGNKVPGLISVIFKHLAVVRRKFSQIFSVSWP